MIDLTKMIELHAHIKKDMRELQSVLEKQSDLSGQISPEDMVTYLHNRRIRTFLSHLRESYSSLGIRLGEQPKREWLYSLTDVERTVFIERFMNKKGYIEIAKQQKMNPEDVRIYFKKAIQKIIENIEFLKREEE